MIGLDTTAIIDLFKGVVGIKELLEKIHEPLVVSMVNYSEVQFGLNPNSRKHNDEAEFYDEFFSVTHNVPLSPSACKTASAIMWSLRDKGKVIGSFDCLVAGSYMAKGITKIITRNVKHFEHIKGLKVLSY